jgi:phosphoribosylamine---glycine ligase
MTQKMITAKPRIMVFGIGTFAHSTMRALREAGAVVSCYLTRTYGHYGPSLEGETFYYEQHPDPCPLLKKKRIDLVIPMSIDWHLASWANEFLDMNIPILAPKHDAMLLERDRDYARKLCKKYKINYPVSHVAKNRLEAEAFLDENPRPYVLKNPLCSPGSPIHTIVCETVEDTRSWLSKIDYAEGVFMQEYLGKREAGHICFVSGGEVYPMVTNQEYKRAFDGNMGPVAGAPLGGLVEQDLEDKYGLVKELIAPLLPWFRETNFHGPVQVTAVKRDKKWYTVEYNVRTGITTGPALWRMLEKPLQVVQAVARNEKISLEFRPEKKYACNLTLAGWGYPYTKIIGPGLPVKLTDRPDCDVWWNEIDTDSQGNMILDGHRIADVIAFAPTLDKAIEKVYDNIKKISCLSSYYRLDVGKSLWPPGEE